MHGQETRRPLGHRRRGGLRIDVQRAPVDVTEDRPRLLVQHGVRRRDEAERGRDDLVTGRDAGRAQGEVEPGGPARDRRDVLDAEPRAERLLELGEPGPEREVARAQHIEDELLLARADRRAARAG